jgi:hypothetical protein
MFETRTVTAPPVQIRQMVSLTGITPRPLLSRQPQEIQERSQVTCIAFLRPPRTGDHPRIAEEAVQDNVVLRHRRNQERRARQQARRR